MGSDISLISGDPERNPLLSLAIRGSVPGTWLGALFGVLLAIMCLASFYDLWRGRMIPHWITNTVLVTGVVIPPLAFEDWRAHYVIAGAVLLLFGAFYWLGGIGMADLKLYIAFGLLFGFTAVYIIAATHVIATVVMVPIALRKRDRKLAAPMFPFAAAALVLVSNGIGAPPWMTASGAALLAVAVLYGLYESRFRTPPSITDHLPLMEGRDEIRLRAGSRPLERDADGNWTEIASAPRVSGAALDRVVYQLVGHDPDLRSRLDRGGELRIDHVEDGRPFSLTVTETTHSYAVVIGPGVSAPVPDPLPA
ncbi:A24 family peptidase [Miltoncostaea oceani]|uniref:A24 family peptidase n=1 Tax=Miltoncostaea oceani TaxID=2843216 RepID=UPI001C3E2825|nr:prepilin peptidase [Miltoncostaea oceani]